MTSPCEIDNLRCRRPPKLPVEIGEVDRRGRILWAEPQRGLVFDLGIRAPGVEISQRGAGFGPIGVEALGGG
jgi:hypothetical protein